jgi:hypothetical protein
VSPDSLARIWVEIENSRMSHDRGWVRRQTNPGAVVPVHAAIACSDSRRSLMIDIPLGALGVLQDLPITGGLAVRLEAPLEGVPSDQRTLLVELEDRQYNDIFEIFCAHLIDGLSKCVKVYDATTLLLARLTRWQDFLRRSRDHLGQQAVIGLFGELWLLRDLLIPQGGVGTISSWAGAQQAPQDFIFPGLCAVEVKTSTARPVGSATIHGERQLDDTGLRCLFLACLRLEVDDRGESLNEVVASLRERTATAPEFADGFEFLLAQAGWLERHAPFYESLRFRVAQQRFFEVSGKFPRVIPGALPPGVDNVAYCLDLKTCVDHERSRSYVEQLFSSLDLSLRALS